MSEPLHSLYHCIYPLLRLLAELPDTETPWPEILAAFEARHGAHIPAEQRTPQRPGAEPIWHNMLASARWRLIEQRFVAGMDPAGWRITPAGRQWLAEHSDLTDWPPREPAPEPPAISYAPLPSSTPAAASNGALPTEVEPPPTREILDAELLAAARAPLHRIQSYLRGLGGEHPSGEVVCDWILLTYTLGLYREAVNLWPYVNPEQVQEWYYRRTERIVQACRARLGR
jgi:hypothetical protein